MRRTLQFGDLVATYKGDFSGNVTIMNRKTDKTARIPAELVLLLAAEYVRVRKTSQFEAATPDQILLGEWGTSDKFDFSVDSGKKA